MCRDGNLLKFRGVIPQLSSIPTCFNFEMKGK